MSIKEFRTYIEKLGLKPDNFLKDFYIDIKRNVSIDIYHNYYIIYNGDYWCDIYEFDDVKSLNMIYKKELRKIKLYELLNETTRISGFY